MKGALAASRYAKSLMGLSIEKNNLDAVYADMEKIAATVAESKDFELLLKSPVVKTHKKQSILQSVFGGNVSDLTNAFLQLISSRKREAIVGDIAKSFIQQYKVLKNIIVAEVTTAIQLDDTQKQKILNLLKKDETSTIEVIEKIDSEIIGGFIVRVDDKQIDASIARELSDLKQEFNKNPYIADF